MKAVPVFALASALLATAFPAAAQFAKSEDAIKYRQGALFVMGQHFSRLGAMANGRAPFDAKAAAENADLVLTLSHLPWAGFVPGSDKGASTRAEPAVWTENDKFKAAAEKFQGEAVKLAAAAKTGSLDNLKAAFGPTAASCKACHDNFRK
ncbi:c-type cytochrome [Pseudorhodoferax sp.]|uniref:c-type cytochrome n=1 Tax=Pseudorhodoferax sp. TaxID=1993553 RepID=UPI0039E5314C